MKTTIKKYSLIILGFILFSLYFWNRFLRSRTSKILPLDLSLLRFFILIYVCGIFAFILYSLIRQRGANHLVDKIIDWLFTPISEFDRYFKNLPRIIPVYERFLAYIVPKLDYFIIQTHLFFIIFWLVPRLILLSALFIDVFIFYQLHYKYQIIFIGLLLFFNRCFRYSLKNSKKDLLTYYEPYIRNVSTDYVPGVHPSEFEPDYDPEDPDNAYWYPGEQMSLPLKVFIEFQTESIVYANITRNMSVDTTLKLSDEFWLIYTGGPHPVRYNPHLTKIPKDYKNNFGDKTPDNYYKALHFVFDKKQEFGNTAIKKIMDLSLLIEYYNKTSNHDKDIKNIKILVYLNYLLCWLYVLIVSLPSLHINELIQILLYICYTCHNFEEPFSCLSLFN